MIEMGSMGLGVIAWDGVGMLGQAGLFSSKE
jgi:hypothetical protein